MNKVIRGIIFDVDGVVINTENIHFLSFQKILKKYNFDLTKEHYKKHFSGKSIKGGILSLLAEIEIAHNLDLEDFITIFSQEKINSTLELFKKKLLFYEDTISFIKKVKKGNIKLKQLGVISPNPKLAFTTGLENVLLHEVLKHYNLLNLIEVVVTADKYIESKPNPECYNTTLSLMELKSENVFGVEDSPSGIKALNEANIFSVGLTTTHRKGELKEAQLIVKSLQEIL